MVIAGAELHDMVLTRAVGLDGQPAATAILLALACARASGVAVPSAVVGVIAALVVVVLADDDEDLWVNR